MSEFILKEAETSGEEDSDAGISEPANLEDRNFKDDTFSHDAVHLHHQSGNYIPTSMMRIKSSKNESKEGIFENEYYEVSNSENAKRVAKRRL